MYNDIKNAIIYNRKMNTIFMNSKNNKTSDPHRLLLNFTNKIDLRIYIYIYILLYQTILVYYTWGNKKGNKEIIKSAAT